MTGSGGPGVGRLRGQELARRELGRSIYRPSLLARIWHDITHWLGSLLSTSPAGTPIWWALLLLAVAVAAAIAAVAYWLGPTRLNKRASDRAVVGSAPRSAHEHRETADQLAANGNYGGAIIERIRAIVVDLEARDILLRRPARTAMELAAEASGAFPAEAAELTYAARGFEDVRYGGRAASAPAYRRVRDLDVRLAAAPATVAKETASQAAQVGLPSVPVSVAPTGQSSGPRQ